jgi:hypothetical protein
MRRIISANAFAAFSQSAMGMANHDLVALK